MELKPCPFCGYAPIIEDIAGWEIRCSNDDCSVIMVLLKPDRLPLVAAWNRRTPSTLAQQVASAQAEVATWSEERRKSVRLAGGDQP